MPQEILYQAAKTYAKNFRIPKKRTGVSCPYFGNKCGFHAGKDCADNFGQAHKDGCVELKRIETEEKGLVEKTNQ